MTCKGNTVSLHLASHVKTLHGLITQKLGIFSKTAIMNSDNIFILFQD